MSDVDPAALPGAGDSPDQTVPVVFEYLPGLARCPFTGATLVGSWTAEGRSDGTWSETAMEAAGGDDGCVVFRAQAAFASVEATGRDALTEIRALLGVRRREGGDLPRAPQPSRAPRDTRV